MPRSVERGAGPSGADASRHRSRSRRTTTSSRTVGSTTPPCSDSRADFAARVVGPGDRIAACLGNGTEIVVAFYAAQCLGVIVNARRDTLGKPNRQWAVGSRVASDAGVASQEVTA